MDDLIAFLRARLDEREHIARAAAEETETRWHAGHEHLNEGVSGADGSPVAYGPYEGVLSWEIRQHIAANDPGTVLADVNVKRRIIEVHQGLHSCGFWEHDDDDPCPTLCLLALPFAGHPDYRQEWRP